MLRQLSLLLVLSLISVEFAWSQAQLDPPRPVITSRQRSIEVNISNPSSKPMEVMLSMEYTVIRTDSLGRVSIVGLELTEEEKSRDCSAWLRIFPRRLALPGGASRTVRLLASIPPETPDGEYWTRLNLDCTPTEAPSELPKLDSGDVAMGVSMTSVLSAPILVRVGTVKTGLQILGVNGVVDSGRTMVVCDLKRTDDSPYRGTIAASVYGADGTILAAGLVETTVEFVTRAGIALPVLGDGSFRLELNANSVRKGSMSEIVVPADPVKQTYSMTISAGMVSIAPMTN